MLYRHFLPCLLVLYCFSTDQAYAQSTEKERKAIEYMSGSICAGAADALLKSQTYWKDSYANHEVQDVLDFGSRLQSRTELDAQVLTEVLQLLPEENIETVEATLRKAYKDTRQKTFIKYDVPQNSKKLSNTLIDAIHECYLTYYAPPSEVEFMTSYNHGVNRYTDIEKAMTRLERWRDKP